jgi:hypothetical protein
MALAWLAVLLCALALGRAATEYQIKLSVRDAEEAHRLLAMGVLLDRPGRNQVEEPCLLGFYDALFLGAVRLPGVRRRSTRSPHFVPPVARAVGEPFCGSTDSAGRLRWTGS